jgi:hypothetical protein
VLDKNKIQKSHVLTEEKSEDIFPQEVQAPQNLCNVLLLEVRCQIPELTE